jgi:hypothetical protein
VPSPRKVVCVLARADALRNTSRRRQQADGAHTEPRPDVHSFVSFSRVFVFVSVFVFTRCRLITTSRRHEFNQEMLQIQQGQKGFSGRSQERTSKLDLTAVAEEHDDIRTRSFTCEDLCSDGDVIWLRG